MNKLLEEFKFLLQEGDSFPKDELKDYYLSPAKALLEANPDICKEVFEDETALMMVVKEIVKPGNHSIREVHLNMLALDIIEYSPKLVLNYQDQEGSSVIHLTCQMECFSVGLLDYMKDRGANFSLINQRGETPLLLIADSESLDDVKFIHAYTSPALLDHRDLITGSTALMKATRARKINNVYFLLENGASVFVEDNLGMTALDLARAKSFQRKGKKDFSEELEELLQLFTEKQRAEQTIKRLLGKT